MSPEESAISDAERQVSTPGSTCSSPVPQAQRIISVDVLRGFALLGILMVNIQSFGFVDAKYMNPMATGEITGANYWTWWFTYVFFDSKFMTLFSALFGAGIVLMWERAKQTSRRPIRLHYRRMFWLMLFGLAHAYLLWYGDILFLYSLCGMIVYWASGLRPRYLIPLGFTLLAVAFGLSLMSGWSMPYWDEAQIAEFKQMWSPSSEEVANQTKAYRGGWLEQLPYRSENAFMMQTFLVAFWGFWRAGGLMLVGMGLYKLGFFGAQWSSRSYAVSGVIAAVIGFTLILTGVNKLNAENWSVEYGFFFGQQFNYWGSLGLSFAYASAVMLVCKFNLFIWLQRSLAAVGQMALTNYLMHTMICTTIFYGHGLALFGQLSRMQLDLIVIAIWALQLWLSPVWLKRFRFGPFEWFWRSLTYWKSQSMARVA
jgi:uncharacterized protein